MLRNGRVRQGPALLLSKRCSGDTASVISAAQPAGGHGLPLQRSRFIVNWDTGSLSGLTSGYWTIELQLSDGRVEWTNLQF